MRTRRVACANSSPVSSPRQFRSEHIVALNVVFWVDTLVAHLLKQSFKLIRLRRSHVRIIFSGTPKRAARSAYVSPSR
jgi:hypothetical protein